MLENPQVMAWESPCFFWTCFPPSRYTWLSTHLHQHSPDLHHVYAAWPRSRMDILDFSHAPPLQSSQKALDVLSEEIVKNVHGAAEDKGVEPTWLMSMANVSTIGVRAEEVGAGDCPASSPCTSHSPVPHASRSSIRHSQTRSSSLHRHLQSSRSSSSSSGSSSRSGSASGSSSSGSSQLGSSYESRQALQLALMLDPAQDLKHLQKAAVPVGQNTLALHHLMKS